MRIKKLTIPIYKYRFTLIESSDPEEMEKYFRKMKLRFDRSSLYAHTFDHIRIEKGEKWLCVYVVLNRKNKWTKMSHSTIAHEAKHIADYIFENIGAEHFNDEPHNYLTEYVVKAINDFFGIKDEIK